MIAIYSFCALVGGGFVLLSAFGGLDGPDFDLDWEFDPDWSDPGRSNAQSRWIYKTLRPFIWLLESLSNFKFWTFGACFFGLTGLLLNYIQPSLGTTIILVIALGMGLIIGLLAARLLRMLHRRQVNSLIQTEDFVGTLATVEIPFDQSSRGKVRIQIKDSILELSAFTNDTKPLQLGEQVVVIGIENNRVWVVSEETLHHSDALPPTSD
ncbi:MAG: NfeD-like protein [Thermosynechococcaceae cyanobacterium MS004]|nr:NfeD-like protein [Thermosynechococcaceae cyanobacterium MS004]